ncbi:MAG: flavodoxin family protein [candidate division WOR-3 bacterium]|nr:flavodoxin family protein [candidate division WOR-3 bacterium]MCX7947977.1 flavodoxin family protein [candidate division WOR-3 bacterium]MDW8150921.1 flavodoxin family protein [candidate division WOR-3 bacterium]
MRILAINGSPRGRKSRTYFLIEKALEICYKLGAEVETIHLSDYYIEHCVANYSKDRESCNLENCIKTRDSFKLIINKMLYSDGIIFGSSVHWFSVSSIMKTLIDRLTSLENKEKYFDGKVAGFVAVAEEDGAVSAIVQMVSVFNFMGFIIPPYAFVYSTGYYEDISKDIEAIEDAKRLGRNMVKLIKLLKQSEQSWWG